jgi:hypothetical protein
MPTDYTVTLSDVEKKALEYVSITADDWIQNAIHERCRLAIDELAQAEITAALAEGRAIVGTTKEEIALASSLPSAQERHDAILSQMMNSPPPGS